jgi:hypothetical protein
VKKRMAQVIYRALSDAAHGKGALPCKMLPCALCRASRRKTHGKEFAVRHGRTTKPLFPVLNHQVLNFYEGEIPFSNLNSRLKTERSTVDVFFLPSR